MNNCTPSNSASDLLLEIARCSCAQSILAQNEHTHPCTEIVKTQNAETPADFFLPEPWNGDIEQAPILFLASNPSIAFDEAFPTTVWTDDRIVEFFTCRFGKWIKDGTHPLKQTGEYSRRSVQFLAAVRCRAAEILDVDRQEVRPGIDYVISEVVHCKSRSEIGVRSAAETCVSQYLQRVLAISVAAVIVSLGAYAASHVRCLYNVSADKTLFGPIEIGGKERYFAFLPHPNYRGKRTLADCLTQAELEQLRLWILKHRQ